MLFDADGVTIINETYFSKKLERDFSISTKITEPFFTGEFQKCITGQADLKELLGNHAKEWGWKKSVDELLAYWFKCEHNVSEELIEGIQKVRSMGIKCYLATNQERYRTDYIIDQMGFGKSFDGVFSSANIGYTKPGKEYFQHILGDLEGILPEEIVYFDDSEKNVIAAKELGIDARLYSAYEDFDRVVKELL